MKDMFLCLLLNLGKFGKVTKAHFYGEDFSETKLETEDSEYTISIMRKDKNSEDKENA